MATSIARVSQRGASRRSRGTLPAGLAGRTQVPADSARCERHGLVEVGIERGNQQTVLSLDDVDLVPGTEAEAVEHGFGENDGDGSTEVLELHGFLHGASDPVYIKVKPLQREG